jgi:RNA polymerase sigma-70 factor (ECF subfamily)
MEPISASTPIPVDELEALAFDDVYRAERDRVYGWALRYSGGRGAWAEDVTHDVFLQLHKNLSRLDRADLGGWLYRVTANRALSRLRHEASWVGRLGRLLTFQGGPLRPDEALERQDDAAAALRLLNTLPPKERMVLSMQVLDGHSQRDIARMLEMSEGYVSKLLTRAWAKIRAAGWEVDDAP